MTYLSLYGNKLESIPQEIKTLTNLQHLWMENVHQHMLPNELSQVKIFQS
jgi:Leucine-rich repeat (LRR) protein